MRSIKLVVIAVAMTFACIAHCPASTSAVKLRSGPGSAWSTQAEISAGTEVTVLNCGPGWRNAWCHVRIGQLKGYVPSTTLAPSGRRKVVVAPVVTTQRAEIHQKASIFSRTIGVIPGGKTVDVVHCNSGIGRGWCRVEYDHKGGYLRGGLLKRRGGESIEFAR
jgi:uncharacterized protein YraI